MGFEISSADTVQAVGYVAASYAEQVVYYLDPQAEYEYVSIHDRAEDVYAFEENVYKVTIMVERA